MAGIKDVAKKAGVGVGTVSRVINHTGYVAEDTRKRIEAAMQELNYTPNELARNLYRNKTGIVAIIIPDLEHPFFAAFCKAAELELYQLGYKTMVCSTVEIGNREQEYLDMLQRNIVDGIITGAHTLNDEAYQKVGKPIVAFDRDLGPDIPLISSDHKQGGRLAAEKLLQNGCTRIMTTTEEYFTNSPFVERYSALTEVLRQNGKELVIIKTAWNRFEFDYFYDTMRQYLEMYPDIDGIFTEDMTAICCVNILKNMGRRVPEDVRVIGYDATLITRMAQPVITAVRQDITALARACARTVVKRINGESGIAMRQVYGVDLQVGGTTL